MLIPRIVFFCNDNIRDENKNILIVSQYMNVRMYNLQSWFTGLLELHLLSRICTKRRELTAQGYSVRITLYVRVTECTVLLYMHSTYMIIYRIQNPRNNSLEWNVKNNSMAWRTTWQILITTIGMLKQL
jgi:hypothetical protein